MDSEKKREEIQNIAENIRSPEELLAMRAMFARKGDPSQFIYDQWRHLRCAPGEEKYFGGRNLRLEDFQWDILSSAFNPRYKIIAIKGCTGAGKGLASAILANIWYDVYSDARIVVSGPSRNHVKETLMSEIRAQRGKMSMPHPAEVNILEIVDRKDPTRALVTRVPKAGEGFSGVHSGHVLFLFDEASGMEEFLFTNALRQSSLIVVLSNPRTTGWFRNLFGKVDMDVTKDQMTDYGMARCITVSMEDLANVKHKRLDVPVGPAGGIEIDGKRYEHDQMIPQKVYEAHAKPLIEGQSTYADYMDLMNDPHEFNRRVFGMGQFPREDQESQVIFEKWLPRHVHFHEKMGNGELIEITAAGLDVAIAHGGDKSALALGGREGCSCVMTRSGMPVEQTAQWVIRAASDQGVDLTTGKYPICVDTGGGYGAIVEFLQQRNVWAIPAHPAWTPEFEKTYYKNVRAEMYGELARRLDPRGKWPDPEELETLSEEIKNRITNTPTEQLVDEPWGLPNDERLHRELLAQKKIIMADGFKFGLIPKRKPNYKYLGLTVSDQLGKGQSPDKADAVALLWRAIMHLDRMEGGGPRYVKVDRPLLLLTRDEQRMISPVQEHKTPVEEVLARLERQDRLEDARRGYVLEAE